MRARPRAAIVAALLGSSVACLFLRASADEMSTDDKLRILYSNRFSFTDGGDPLVTIQVVGGAGSVRVSAPGGVRLLPDGEGGAEIYGANTWTIRLAAEPRPSPALVDEWTIVARFPLADDAGAAAAVASWQSRGYEPRTFAVGSVFGVAGDVIDGRETLVGIAPVRAPGGGERAAELAHQWKVETSVHPELVRRPQGTVEALSDDGRTVVRNPSVVWLAPAAGGTPLTIHDVPTGGGGATDEPTGRQDRRYAGLVYVTVGSDGRLTAVNAVGADRLLAGLVPAEMFPDAPADALMAQAVAARTELLEKIGTRHLTDPFRLCSTQHCQVYAGVGHEHPRTTDAIAKTHGEVLLRPSGHLADARYSASCGGFGEHNDTIWGGAPDPVLRGSLDGGAALAPFRRGIDAQNLAAFLDLPAESAFCGATKFARGRSRWEVDLDAAELSQRVAAQLPSVGAVRGLEPLERGISGRIKALRVRGSRGSAVVHGDLEIRRLLGGLKSSLFLVEPVGDPKAPRAFHIRGAGFGHGVGLCQVGAIGRAQAGQTYRQILDHYYPGTQLHRLY